MLGQDSLLTSPQPLSHLLSYLIFGDPTSFTRVMLEDSVTTMILVTQECWGVHSLASSGISSAHASGGPQLVSAGEQAHYPLLVPTFPLSPPS